MVETFFRSVAKGVVAVGAGALVIGTGGALAPVIGGALIGSGVYTTTKATVRGLRETTDEEDGEMYYVYYSLKSAAGVLNHAIPEFLDTDIIAGGMNLKIAHCKAWFSTGSNSYVTFEVTAEH